MLSTGGHGQDLFCDVLGPDKSDKENRSFIWGCSAVFVIGYGSSVFSCGGIDLNHGALNSSHPTVREATVTAFKNITATTITNISHGIGTT